MKAGGARSKLIATSNMVKPPKKPKACDGVRRLSRLALEGREARRWGRSTCTARQMKVRIMSATMLELATLYSASV